MLILVCVFKVKTDDFDDQGQVCVGVSCFKKLSHSKYLYHFINICI